MTSLRVETVRNTKKSVVVTLVALAAVLIATTPMVPRNQRMTRIKIVLKKVQLERRILGSMIIMLLETLPIKMTQQLKRRKRKTRRRKQRRKNVCKKKRMQSRR